jgi:hypothetical protein
VAVEFLGIAFEVLQTTCTAADGTYTLRGLPVGVFFVRFVTDGRCGAVDAYLTQYYDGAALPRSAMFIGLVNGDVVTGVNGRLLRGTPAVLTVTTSGAGTVTTDARDISCPDRCDTVVPRDSTVTLTAAPAAGFAFTGWSGGGCTGTGQCNVVMNGDQTVSATFAPIVGDPGPGPGGGGGGGGGGTPLPGGSTPVAPGVTPAPVNTRITKSAIDARRGTAKFTLAGSGGVGPLRFECSLVKKGAKARFKRCGATVTYRRLKKGAYVFSARVRDAQGRLDASPATKRLSSRRR